MNSLQDLNKECEKFFGKTFYKAINVGVLIIGVIGILGNIIAYYYGMTDSIRFETVGSMILIFLFTAFLVACVCKVINYVVNLFRSGKVKKFALNVYEMVKFILSLLFLVIVVLLVLLVIIYFSGSCDSGFNTDHIHYERY